MQATPLGHNAPQYCVKNTFIELVDEDSHSSTCHASLPRSMSDSDLSSRNPPTTDFLEWASSKASDSGSGCNTPCGSRKLENEPSQKHRETLDLCDKLAAVSLQKSGTHVGVLPSESVSDPAALQEVQQRLYESLIDLIPVDAEGKKLTMGTILHHQEPVATRCKPCYFWIKGRCTNGESCLRCHCPGHRPNRTQREHTAIRRQQLFQKDEQDTPGPNRTQREHMASRRQQFFHSEDQDTSVGSARAYSDIGSDSNGSLPISGATTPVEEVRENPSLDALELYQRLASLSAQGKAVSRAMVSADEIVKLVPRDSEGNLTSVGTIPHYLCPLGEQCKPCVFWFQEVCHKGEMCLHCHEMHNGQKVKKIRASKATRALHKKELQYEGRSRISL